MDCDIKVLILGVARISVCNLCFCFYYLVFLFYDLVRRVSSMVIQSDYLLHLLGHDKQ